MDQENDIREMFCKLNLYSDRDLGLLEDWVTKQRQWLASAPRLAVPSNASVDQKNNEGAAPNDLGSSTANVGSNGSPARGTRIIDFLLYSLWHHGGNGAYEECFNTAKRMGWKPGSLKNPNPTDKQAFDSFKNIGRGTRYITWVNIKGNRMSITPDGQAQLDSLIKDKLVPQQVLSIIQPESKHSNALYLQLMHPGEKSTDAA